ncbi:hypothetical protein BDN67DRAFT_914930, partial [Paxillus ammoniavirescens]
ITEEPFTPTYIQQALTLSLASDVRSQVMGRYVLLEIPMRESRSKEETAAKQALQTSISRGEYEEVQTARGKNAAEAKRSPDPFHYRVILFVSPHQLGMEYMSEPLALAVPDSFSSAPEGTMPSSSSTLVKGRSGWLPTGS